MNVPHLIAVFNSPLHSVFWTKMTTFENAIHSNPPPPIFFRPICIDIRNPNFFSNFSDFLKRRQILVDFVIKTESHFTFNISKTNKYQCQFQTTTSVDGATIDLICNVLQNDQKAPSNFLINFEIIITQPLVSNTQQGSRIWPFSRKIQAKSLNEVSGLKVNGYMHLQPKIDGCNCTHRTCSNQGPLSISNFEAC